jgi:hypothetical protein
MWDNHNAGALFCWTFEFPAPHGITHVSSQVVASMLQDLEFAYTPVREKVRDLREYL